MAEKPRSCSSPLVHAEELMELENQLAFGSGWETIEIWDAEHVDDDGKEWEGLAGPHRC